MCDAQYVHVSDENAGLKAALAEAQDAARGEVQVPHKTVDSGWRSRKLIVGVAMAALVILLASFLLLVATTGFMLADLQPGAAALIVKFEPRYWLYAVVAALVFLGACIGLISFDKLLDLARDALPILKAKYGIKDPG